MKHADLAYVDTSHFGWYVNASYLVAAVIIAIMMISSLLKYRRYRRRLELLSSSDNAS